MRTYRAAFAGLVLGCAATTALAAPASRRLDAFSSGVDQLVAAIDVDSVAREGDHATVDIVFTLPQAEDRQIGGRLIHVRDYVIHTEFDCTAKRTRPVSQLAEDADGSYPVEPDAPDWVDVKPEAPSNMVMKRVCAAK